MREPTVASLMTGEVIGASPETPFQDLVRLLGDNRISALPVVEDDRPVGVVSEADLLPKEEFRAGAEKPPGFFAARAEKHRWTQSAGLTARDVMTSPVWTTTPDTPASRAARELATADVRRLFVIDGDGVLVGVLSRRDLLRLFVREDSDLRREIQDEVFGRTLWVDPLTIGVTVSRGVVTLSGRLERRSEIDIAEHLVRSMPGVVEVHNNLRPEWDDSKPPRQTEIFG